MMGYSAPADGKVRLFVTGDLALDRLLALPEGQSLYLLRVMRLGRGDAIRVFNGRQGEWLGRIERLEKAAATVAVERLLRPQAAEDGPWLVFGPVKKSPTDYIVEKATELGAAALWPVMTERTIVQRMNVTRLQALAVEAAEQCGRLTVPAIMPAATLSQLVARWVRERPLLVAHPNADERAEPIGEALASLRSATSGIPVPPPPGFLVGPEGGLAPGELDVLASLPCAKVVRLGRRTLRAETAAAALLACWQAIAGDWRNGGSPPAS